MERKIEDSREDIIKCMDMARDGMHAILMVVSATSRFSREDEKTIKAIKMFFDDTIIDHLILVFTNGDRIGEDNWMKMLTDDNCPKYLQVYFIYVCPICSMQGFFKKMHSTQRDHLL